MSQYIVSARKYRPDSFETLVGQDNIARTLKNSILRGQLAHAYLFCGPRGVGKTSTARIFAKTINCSNPGPDMEPCGECESCVSFSEGRSYCIHELDAASNNGVDDIKALMEQVQIPPQVGKYSVYIIDEVHMLSQAAFNAFLKTLEEPPAHAIFILATTEKHKILPTILSRCQTYDFNRIGVPDIVSNLKGIASKEGVDIDDESLHIIARKADGAMRDALTIFDQSIAFCGTMIRYEDTIRNLNVLDYEYSFRLVDAFLAGDYATAMIIFDEILSKGFNAQYFISSLSSHLRDLAVSRTAGLEAFVDQPLSVRQRYLEQAGRCSMQFLYDALAITTQCEAGYKAAVNQRLHIEFALMKLCFLKSGVPAVRLASGAEETPSKEVKASSGEPNTPKREPKVQTPDQAEAEEPRPQPRRKAASVGATLSLNSLMNDETETPAKVEAAASAAPGAGDISDEAIISKWRGLSANYPNQQRLANTIANGKLEISRQDGEILVTLVVVNEAQCNWIREKKLHELEGGLLAALGNPSGLKLAVEAAAFVEEKVIYTPEDKTRYLIENNPGVKDIITDLGLDLR